MTAKEKLLTVKLRYAQRRLAYVQGQMKAEKMCTFCRHEKLDIESGNPVCDRCFIAGGGVPGIKFELRRDLK